MSDFMLDPDESDPERPERSRPVRVVGTGLAPTAAVPALRRQRAHPPCYASCEACGERVLTGVTAQGQRLALDPQVATYVVIWEKQAPLPRLVPSQAYPVHRCLARGRGAP
jgi:hypothetical protein